MRPNRLRHGAIAVWLGIIALGFNALVPIHLAFDLAGALGSTSHRENSSTHQGDFTRQLLTLVTGHHDEDTPAHGKTDGHGRHHHPDCAVCGSLGTLSAFAPATAVLLPVPIRIEAPASIVAKESTPRAAPEVAYRSRAPPNRNG
jgi:Protein of unknown function (DUF2946)